MELKKNKKGLSLGDAYQAVLVLVLLGIVIGVGVLVLDKFQASSGVTAAAGTPINDSRDAIGDFATDWMSVIVVVIAAAVILGLVIGAFMYRR